MKKNCFFILFFILFFANVFNAQAQTKGYEKMGKFTLKQLDGHWSAPANVKLLGNGKEILLKKLFFSMSEMALAITMDFQEIVNDKPTGKDESRGIYTLSLANDVLVLMMNKDETDDKDSAFTPYIFVVKKIDAQNMILSTDKEDFIFKKVKN